MRRCLRFLPLRPYLIDVLLAMADQIAQYTLWRTVQTRSVPHVSPQGRPFLEPLSNAIQSAFPEPASSPTNHIAAHLLKLHEPSQRKRSAKGHLERYVILQRAADVGVAEDVLQTTVWYYVNAAGLESLWRARDHVSLGSHGEGDPLVTQSTYLCAEDEQTDEKRQ